MKQIIDILKEAWEDGYKFATTSGLTGKSDAKFEQQEVEIINALQSSGDNGLMKKTKSELVGLVNYHLMLKADLDACIEELEMERLRRDGRETENPSVSIALNPREFAIFDPRGNEVKLAGPDYERAKTRGSAWSLCLAHGLDLPQGKTIRELELMGYYCNQLIEKVEE